MSIQWITPAGLIATLTELVSTSTSVVATGTNTTYAVISGHLPTGLTLSTTGIISGTPAAVPTTVRNKFVIRATKDNQISDRTFYLDVDGPDDPIWSTTEGYLPIGYNGERYAISEQFIDYHLSATAEVLPVGKTMTYYIADGDGRLPKGIQLSKDGRLYGTILENLIQDGKASSEGGYDDEPYDGYSYDHSVTFSGTATQTAITSSPIIFKFYVTATDGISSSRRMFKILVAAPDMFRADSILFGVGSEIFTIDGVPSSVSYLQPIQFLEGSDLGVIRANNQETLYVGGYDPEPGRGPVVYSITTGTNPDTKLPANLTLDPTLGYIYGFIPYQPAYTRNYNLTINATKTDSKTGKVVTATNTFTLAVKGEIESSIEWVTTSTLGSIDTGITSELAIKAVQTNSEYSVRYQLIDGELPPGMTLESDGSISGKADYGSTGTYTFRAEARDVYELSAIERDFNLEVTEYNGKEFAEIYMRPFLTKEKRQIFQNFMANEQVFDPKLLYRYFDPNFGVQNKIKMVLEFGLERVPLRQYMPAIYENFYRKRLYFGDIKVAIAKDANGTPVYEVVYLDVIDDMVNNDGVSASPAIYINGTPYYPGSITNMRRNLRALALDDFSYVDIDEFMLPRFMRTAQDGSYKPPGYMRVVPLCYALPGQGSKIVSRIKISGFSFKQFDFEVDRIIVQNPADSNSAKYIIFDRQNMADQIPEDMFLWGDDGIRFDTEDLEPLIYEK